MIIILGTTNKGLVKRLEDLELKERAEAIQIAALKNWPEY